MSKLQEKIKATKLRDKGYSYSHIMKTLNVSKSTLSLWLHNNPLSKERIRELRDNNPKRIENYRLTMKIKRDLKNKIAYDFMLEKIGKLSEREFFIAGLFLYWAEGTKTKSFGIGFTNTNLNMITFFIKWLKFFNVAKSKIKIHLHLYSDMNVNKEINFWSKELNIPKNQFRKPYIKTTKLSSITYKNGFGHGTCSVIVDDGDLSRKILMGVNYIQKL